MQHPFLVGKHFYMRGLKVEDLEVTRPYFQWLNDQSLDTYTERSYFPNTPERARAYFDHAQRYEDLLVLAIIDKQTDKHVGNVALSSIDWIQRRAFIAYLLGDSDFAGKGYTTDAVLMLMYYGFNKLNFDRIYGGVNAEHAASRRVCAKVGLLEEGVFRGHLMRNGRRIDVVPVGALRDEWMKAHGKAAIDLYDIPPT